MLTAPGGKMQRGENGSFTQVLVHLLCKKVSGHSDDIVSELFKNALVTLSSNIYPCLTGNEVDLTEKIKRKLAHNKSDKAAADFSELHRKLQALPALSDRWPALYLLYRLANFNNTKPSAKVFEFGGFMSSTPITHNGIVTAQGINVTGNTNNLRGFLMDNVSSISEFPSVLSHIKASLLPNVDASGDKKSTFTIRSFGPIKDDSNRQNVSETSWSCSQEYQEDILRDIIYVLQGIDGKEIIHDDEREIYKIKPGVEISKSASTLVGRLCECGFLHNKIRKYMDSKLNEHMHGLTAQSFCSALHQELTEYYRLVANLETQIQQEEGLGISSTQRLTLRRVLVWLNEPIHRLTIIASLIDVCQGKKGGELASAIYSFTRHGDPNVQNLTRKILSLVVHPIFNFVTKWIYNGELEDPYQEFFVASDAKVKDERLWIEKYSLRNNMIPSFITSNQARKILLTGKTISFLRQVCSDRTLIKDRDVVKAADTSKVEAMFSQGQDSSFTKMIDIVYRETSSYLLKVLYERYKFMDHLKAMRNYLLLGQGDFIRHLMDLLEEDLAKPAQTLFLHNLTGILESAIRATNVQYDDPDIIRRLDVRRLEVSPGDTGWMVFSLEYHVPDHIGMVFTPESMTSYLKVSNFLWSAKRMEYILSVIWREQMAHARIFRPYPELAPVLHTYHLIASEMLHFVQQIQYYINFEVLECSWVELMMKVELAGDLDQVIHAHKEFLGAITSRSLLDPQLKDIVTRLRTIFDLIIRYQEVQGIIHSKMMREVESRKAFEDEKESRRLRGEWATNSKLEEREEKRMNQFIQNFITTALSDIKILRRDYKIKVEEFLSLVSQLSDVSLRCLIFRLNFNEHYQHTMPHAGRSSSIFIPPSIIQSKRKAK